MRDTDFVSSFLAKDAAEGMCLKSGLCLAELVQWLAGLFPAISVSLPCEQVLEL